VPNEVTTNGHMFYVLARNPAERAALIAHLKAQGIHAVFHYVPLHSSPAGRRFGRASGELAVTDDVASRLVRLPLYYELSESGVAQVVDAVRAFFAE
jgi:dTDP-4-amino-4,6-dideoxygalactose transaminase